MEVPRRLLERYRLLGIILFILVVILLGVLLISYGAVGGLEVPQNIIVTSLGGALIGVGLIDVVSEVFLKPSTIGTMREMLTRFISEPKKLPKPLKMALVRSFVEVLSPTEALSQDIVKLFDEIFLTQLSNTYRDDCSVSLKLRKETIAKNVVARVITEVSYRVHNLTDRPYKYSIPFLCNTVSFIDKGIPIEEHIKLEKIAVCSEEGVSTDVGAASKAYSVCPEIHSLFPSKVELRLPQNPTFDIAPKGSATILVRYAYLAQCVDDHVHKMKQLTRNITLNLDFLESEFVLDIDTFCIPTIKVIDPNKKYEWRGWFVPYHGFCVAWQPT